VKTRVTLNKRRDLRHYALFEKLASKIADGGYLNLPAVRSAASRTHGGFQGIHGGSNEPDREDCAGSADSAALKTITIMGDVLQFSTIQNPEHLDALKALGVAHPARRRVEGHPYHPHFIAHDTASCRVLTAIPTSTSSEPGGRFWVIQRVHSKRPPVPEPAHVLLALFNGAVVMRSFRQRRRHVESIESVLQYFDRRYHYTPDLNYYEQLLRLGFEHLRELRLPEMEAARLAHSLDRSGVPDELLIAPQLALSEDT
jgi:hypothetical protein